MSKLLDSIRRERKITLNEPLFFHPYLKPLVWGGRKLASLGKTLPPEGSFGESWEISDHSSHSSEVRGGSFDGETLRGLMEAKPQELLGNAGRKHKQFPWLIKFLDAQDWLSVQVHPDEDSVELLWPGEGSKNEAWFILQADPGSRIYAGLLPGVTENQVRQASLNGTVAELLHQFQPRAGDCLYLPAGTVHAVGGGVLIAEIQQTSDATFRLFDWNRQDAKGKARPLHLEESLACVHWGALPPKPVHVPGFGNEPQEGVIPLVDCPYFRLEYVCQRKQSHFGGLGRLQVAIVLSGEGTLGNSKWEKGDSILFPASLAETLWAPNNCQELLLATLI